MLLGVPGQVAGEHLGRQVPPELHGEQEREADRLRPRFVGGPLGERGPAGVGDLVRLPVAGAALARPDQASVGHRGELPIDLALGQ